ncbi:MAG: hypothetical protein AAGJ40_11400 [Planctomycetota bacterium]
MRYLILALVSFGLSMMVRADGIIDSKIQTVGRNRVVALPEGISISVPPEWSIVGDDFQSPPRFQDVDGFFSERWDRSLRHPSILRLEHVESSALSPMSRSTVQLSMVEQGNALDLAQLQYDIVVDSLSEDLLISPSTASQTINGRVYKVFSYLHDHERGKFLFTQLRDGVLVISVTESTFSRVPSSEVSTVLGRIRIQ